MRLVINPNWRIKSDSLQWIVQKRRTVKGQDKWDSISFHIELDGAVLGLARRRVFEFQGGIPPLDLKAICQALDTIKQEILSALNRADLSGLRASNANGGEQHGE